MKRYLLVVAIILVLISDVFAVPNLQMFISGATYNRDSQSWVTRNGEFDLFVISANVPLKDVIVRMSLATGDIPDGVRASFDGTSITSSDWAWGNPPIAGPVNGFDREDLYPHNSRPAWYTEIHTGTYGLTGLVDDVSPDNRNNSWDPSSGQNPHQALGEIKKYHVVTGGAFQSIRLSAYSFQPIGPSYQAFYSEQDVVAMAPVPEPGSIALLGTGLLGLAGFAFGKRRK